MIFNLYKNRGETPLECLERFRKTNPELEKVSMTYLGRLDPLAEGVLLVGTEEHTKQKEREKFFGLDKEYEFVALFGFATDTYDVMGKILEVADFAKGYVVPKDMDLIKICKIYEGEREQKYPEYSSKILATRRTPSPTLPQKERVSENPSLLERGRGEVKKVQIYKLNFKKLDVLSPKELFGRILMDISRVKGDFRQPEILEDWKEFLMSKAAFDISLGFFSAHVSSGTYIRSLVNDMGNTLGIPATTLSIKRTRVGDYKIEDSLKF